MSRDLKTMHRRRKINDPASGGFTLIEAMLGITISAIILMGLVVSALAIMYHYRNDWVLMDLRNYGNIIMEEIGDEMKQAKDIQVNSIEGKQQIEVKDWNDNLNVISATGSEGFLLNNRPMLNGVYLPKTGEYRENKQRVVNLVDFTCKSLQSQGVQLPGRGTGSFEKSVFDVSFTLALTTNYSGEGPLTEYMTFTKTIFASSKYGGLRNAAVSPPPIFN